MADKQTNLEKQLKAAGFRIVRSKTHKVWKDDDGRTVVTPVSASDWRAEQNLVHQLKKMGVHLKAR